MSTATSIGKDGSHSTSLDVISLRAFEKWSARGQPSDTSLLDWLEAESELCQFESLSRRIEGLEQRLADQLTQSNRLQSRLELEHAVARILALSSSLGQAAPRILQTICDKLGYGVGVLWIVDRGAAVLRCEEAFQIPDLDVREFMQATRRMTFLHGEGLPGRVWAIQSAIASRDVAADTSLPRNTAAASADLHGAVAFPVRNGAEFLGVMEFFGREVGEPDRECVDVMSSIGSQISQFIERRNAEAELHAQQEERRVAGHIQQRLLPLRKTIVPGYDISGRCVSAFDVGGDCFDFMPMMTECGEGLGVLVGDASGHGIAAALLIAETRASLRALAMTCPDVDRLLSLVNQRFVEDPEREGFVTVMLLRLTPRSGDVVHANAGHCPGIIFDSRGNVRELLRSTGFPLGIDPSAQFSAESATLRPGELLLLYSDGTIESCSERSELFGIQRLSMVVGAHVAHSSQDVLEAVFSEIGRFREGCSVRDDMTIVVIKRNGESKTGVVLKARSGRR